MPADRVIETERLVLTPPSLDDFADSYAMWSDPAVTRFIGGRPFTEEECWGRMLRYAGLWSLFGMGYWTAREKASGRHVGEIGYGDFHRDGVHGFDRAPEIGWSLNRAMQGKGYASEGVAAALDWIQRDRGPGVRTVCLIAADNAPSIAVAHRAGFAEYARIDYKGSPTILYQRNA